MANYLYYVGGADARPSQTIPGTYEFSTYVLGGTNAVAPSSNLNINGGTYNGAACGDAFGGGGFNGGYNNADNWTKDWNAAGIQPPAQVFVIGCVDADMVSDLNIGGPVQGFTDRTGNTTDQVAHHGSLATNVYTVLAPGNVSKFGSQNDGTVLVWYIAGGSLGAGANAIGLPMRGQYWPVQADTDIDAASKMLYFGLGVFRENSGKHASYGWAPQG